MNRGKTAENAAAKGLRYLRQRGLREFTDHAVEKARDKRFDYQKWILKQRITSVQAGYQKKLRMAQMPWVHVIVAPGEADCTERGAEDLLAGTIRSVKESTYPNVSLVQALNSQIPDEDYLACVCQGDLIERNAFFEMVQAVQNGADAVYTDSDYYERKDGSNTYSDPMFKPDYNPDYLRSFNYIGSLMMVRVGIIRSFYEEGHNDRIPTGQNLADPAFYYALTLRCMSRAGAQGGVRHVPKVLCHVLKRDLRGNMADGSDLKDRTRREKILAIPLVFLSRMVLATALELATSYLLEFFTGSWPWQTYADYRYNFEARIALSPSVRFGLGGILFLYVLQPLFDRLIDRLGPERAKKITVLLAVILITDAICTFLL